MMIISENPLLFRFHRGGLDMSMETVQEINSFEQLMSVAVGDWHINPIKIEIKPYIYDKRIDWDTHMVIIHDGNTGYPIGFLNRKPDWEIKVAE